MPRSAPPYKDRAREEPCLGGGAANQDVPFGCFQGYVASRLKTETFLLLAEPLYDGDSGDGASNHLTGEYSI